MLTLFYRISNTIKRILYTLKYCSISPEIHFSAAILYADESYLKYLIITENIQLNKLNNLQLYYLWEIVVLLDSIELMQIMYDKKLYNNDIFIMPHPNMRCDIITALIILKSYKVLRFLISKQVKLKLTGISITNENSSTIIDYVLILVKALEYNLALDVIRLGGKLRKGYKIKEIELFKCYIRNTKLTAFRLCYNAFKKNPNLAEINIANNIMKYAFPTLV